MSYSDGLSAYLEALSLDQPGKKAQRVPHRDHEQENIDRDQTEPSTLSAPAASSCGAESVDKATKRQYNNCILEARAFERQGDLEQALECYRMAFALVSLDKLETKMKRLEKTIAEGRSSETVSSPATAPKTTSDTEASPSHHADDSAAAVIAEAESAPVTLPSGLRLSKSTHDALYPHQREGIDWINKLYTEHSGGILGDDMGLGKTIQVVNFIGAAFEHKQMHKALIVMPLSLLANWKKEFEKWAPNVKVRVFHDLKKNDRYSVLRKLRKHGGVCITTYGMILSQTHCFRAIHESVENEGRPEELETGLWDFLVLDEGHKVKNPAAQLSKALYTIEASTKIILSGTPIQNNLVELWSLFNFVCDGKLLGSRKQFSMRFESHIIRASERDASESERMTGATTAAVLRDLIAPHFLRREKSLILKIDDGTSVVEASDPSLAAPNSAEVFQLKRKDDVVVWLRISRSQQKLYESILENTDIDELLLEERSNILAALNALKKLCDHPELLKPAMRQERHGRKGLAELALCDDDDTTMADAVGATPTKPARKVNPKASQLAKLWRAALPSSEEEIQEAICNSVKMRFLVRLLANLRQNNHRVLIFSQSVKMLDLIEVVLKFEKHRSLRIDGTVSGPDRQECIDRFNNDSSIFCFMLTTQVGGVGLTLTSADRVVIFDPCWNPATDAQAVDRVYRIGQSKDVVIYRLITCGTIEEKIYCRQVFKQTLSRVATEKKNPDRHFTQAELRELFLVGDLEASTVQQQLSSLYDSAKVFTPRLSEHLSFLRDIGAVGINFHDMIFSAKADGANQSTELAVQEGSEMYLKAKELLTSGLDAHADEQGEWAGKARKTPRAEKTAPKPRARPVKPAELSKKTPKPEPEPEPEPESLSSSSSYSSYDDTFHASQSFADMDSRAAPAEEPSPAVVSKRRNIKRAVLDDSDDEDIAPPVARQAPVFSNAADPVVLNSDNDNSDDNDNDNDNDNDSTRVEAQRQAPLMHPELDTTGYLGLDMSVLDSPDCRSSRSFGRKSLGALYAEEAVEDEDGSDGQEQFYDASTGSTTEESPRRTSDALHCVSPTVAGRGQRTGAVSPVLDFTEEKLDFDFGSPRPELPEADIESRIGKASPASLDAAQLAQYNSLLGEASRCLAMGDRHQALDRLLSAVGVCDSDLALHASIAKLASDVGMV